MKIFDFRFSIFDWQSKIQNPKSKFTLCLLLALALRLALWMQPLHQLANDEIEYVTVARDLLAGRGWQFYEHYHWLRAPLYPLFLAASLWLTHGDLHLAAIPNILLSLATIPLIYTFTKTLQPKYGGSSEAALISALLFTLATFASLYMAETLFTFLFTAALWLLLRWDQNQHGRWTLALAGIAFGLATLTRSISLAFLPIMVVWIVTRSNIGQSKDRISRYAPRLVCGLLFALYTFLPIAPWTLHNCVAYRSCILVETGLSYNLWAFNEPRESEETIFRTLENIPNPATRAEYATNKGLTRLREDPAILLRKLWPNWNYLWRVNPIIEDRFILTSYYADPPPLIFLAALVLDDALYALVLIAGLIGLTRVRRSRAQLLCAAWLAYVVAVTLVTHAEGRYRHFLFPVLIPCAALVLARGRRTADALDPGFRPASFVLRLSSFILVVLLLYSIAANYPWEWAWGGARRSALELVGDLAAWHGDLPGAQTAYQRAERAQATPDVWLRIGDVRRAARDNTGALDAYAEAGILAPSYVATAVRRGDLLRQVGRTDDARRAFQVPYTSPQVVLDWAWSSLHPSPAARLEIGDGLDFGYLTGVYAAEQQQGELARWSDGHAQLRLAVGAQPARLQLRLAAARPDGRPVQAEVCLVNSCTTLTVTQAWRTYSVILPSALAKDTLVELRSDTFVASDGRQLGVLIDWAAVGK